MPEPSAQVVRHSVSPAGIEIYSMGVSCHRLILAEINTHRVFSRSYRSSRAVPVEKLLAEVRNDPAMPVKWFKNQKGMQGTEELTDEVLEDVKDWWTRAAKEAAYYAEAMAVQQLHKQTANRVLEPYLFTHGIITSTEWENFFGLRVHPDAQPEFDVLAKAILKAMRESEPALLHPGEWHLPYTDPSDFMQLKLLKDDVIESLKLISAARCARASYKVFDADRKSTFKEDQELAGRLITSGHWGPFEHQATPDVRYFRAGGAGEESQLNEWLNKHVNWMQPHLHGNFVGWCQNRKFYPNETRSFVI